MNNTEKPIGWLNWSKSGNICVSIDGKLIGMIFKSEMLKLPNTHVSMSLKDGEKWITTGTINPFSKSIDSSHEKIIGMNLSYIPTEKQSNELSGLGYDIGSITFGTIWIKSFNRFMLKELKGCPIFMNNYNSDSSLVFELIGSD